MHRIDTPDAAPGNLFTDGNPAIPTLATYVDAAWANAVQEEIANVIIGAGIVLDKTSHVQLLLAILQLTSGAVLYNVAQALTVAQQAQARTNINAPSRAFAYFMGQS